MVKIGGNPEVLRNKTTLRLVVTPALVPSLDHGSGISNMLMCGRLPLLLKQYGQNMDNVLSNRWVFFLYTRRSPKTKTIAKTMETAPVHS